MAIKSKKNVIERIFSAITGEDVEHKYSDPDYKEFLEMAERTGEPVIVKTTSGIEFTINPPHNDKRMRFDAGTW